MEDEILVNQVTDMQEKRKKASVLRAQAKKASYESKHINFLQN